jgi:hypothetical protein
MPHGTACYFRPAAAIVVQKVQKALENHISRLADEKKPLTPESRAQLSGVQSTTLLETVKLKGEEMKGFLKLGKQGKRNEGRGAQLVLIQADISNGRP